MRHLLPLVILILFVEQVATHPGQRVDPELIYSPELKRVVLVDGQPPFLQKQAFTTIWTWNGTEWLAIPASNGPAPRYASAAAFDRNTNGVLLFSGRSGLRENIVNDSWLWREGQWINLPDSTMPARDHHSMCYNEKEKKTILFGGGIFPRKEGPWASDTWAWNGQRWEQIALEGPTGRVAPLVYNASSGGVFLFGGVGAPNDGYQPKYADTWEFKNDTWRKLSDVGPPPRSRHAMAYDKKRKRVVLYGGENDGGPLGDLWEWDGGSWKELTFSGPNPGTRYVHAMAYDEYRSVIVLYGGMNEKKLMSDTWEWNGRYWTKVFDNEVTAVNSR